MTHPTEIKGLTVEELAKAVANLRYDALAKFFESVALQLWEDCLRDREAGRTYVAKLLEVLALQNDQTATVAEKLWKICEPHMKG